MNEALFPSGPWTGFYNYHPGDRHRMELHLTFVNGNMSGNGNDDIGRFLVKGRYDAATLECYWTKTYVGAHDVFYRGFREGKGIWGTWEINIFGHGGFHIWPRRAGEGEAESESAVQAEPVDAIAAEAVTQTAGASDPRAAQIRRPKPEIRRKPEARNPKQPLILGSLLVYTFSDFRFRISDFHLAPVCALDGPFSSGHAHDSI